MSVLGGEQSRGEGTVVDGCIEEGIRLRGSATGLYLGCMFLSYVLNIWDILLEHRYTN